MVRTMRVLTLFFLLFTLNTEANDKKPKFESDRIKIGPTLSSPLEYNDKLYFLSTTGVLYQSDKKMKKIKDLFKADRSSASGLNIYDDIAYFGEGTHKDTKSNLYAFDIKKNELVFKVEVGGHIEKEPVMKDGLLYVSMGAGGFGGFDIKDRKFVWQVEKDEKSKFHIDSTPVFYKDQVCVSSVYEFKGLLCFESKTGKVISKTKLKYSAKSELGISGSKAFGFATEGTMSDTNWKTSTIFYIFDIEKKKLIKEVELRGYNFFAPLLINKDEVFVNISTGDIITISLINGKITYVSEFPEPFLSSPFKYNGQFCSIGAMGMLLCFSKNNNNYGLKVEKRYFESPVGRIKTNLSNNDFLPSRIGFFKL